MREIWLKIGATSGAKVYALVIGLVTLVVTARVLGPEGRGIIAGALVWVGLFHTFGHLSLGQVAIHRATRLRGTPWLGSTLGSLLAIAGTTTVLGCLVAAGLYWWSDGSLYGELRPLILVVAFLMLPVMIWEKYGSSLLMAVNRLRIYNRAQVIGRTTGFLAVLILLWMGWGPLGVLVALVLGQLIVSGAGLRFLLKHAETGMHISKGVVRDLLSGGAKLHLNAIGAFTIYSADVLMLNYFRSTQEVGHYQLAVQLIGVAMIVPQSAAMVLYSTVAKLGPDGAWDQQKRVLLWLTGGMILAAGAGAIIAPWAIPVVMGGAFQPSVAIFQLLAIALVGLSFSTIMTSQWIGRGLFWQVSIITLTIGLINFLGNLILIPRFGMYGAALATIAAAFLLIVANGIMALWANQRQPRMGSSVILSSVGAGDSR